MKFPFLNVISEFCILVKEMKIASLIPKQMEGKGSQSVDTATFANFFTDSHV